MDESECMRIMGLSLTLVVLTVLLMSKRPRGCPSGVGAVKKLKKAAVSGIILIFLNNFRIKSFNSCNQIHGQKQHFWLKYAKMKSYMYMKSYIAVHAMSYLNIGILPIESGFLLSDLSLFSRGWWDKWSRCVSHR